MTYSRHKCREQALQNLYQLEIVGDTPIEESIENFFLQVNDSEEAQIFAKELILGTQENQKKIDKILKENLEHWRLERLSVTVRNLLRMAVYEMEISKGTPYEVVIDEAVTLAKDFVDDIARSFVNKVLQNIHDKNKVSKD